MSYIGRFAPSPTGPLHIGSLYTALASYLDARHQGGRWLLRIDDIDAPRAEPGAADEIQRALEAHGLLWDGSTAYQSRHSERYRAALAQLGAAGDLFYCRCSRAQLAPRQPYPGHCRDRRQPVKDAAIRIRVDAQPIVYVDEIEGRQSTDLSQTCGDFIVWRRDGLPAYQLATAVDDADGVINKVVRGNDLAASTPRQLRVMQRLGLKSPAYAHLPVIVDSQGHKLSKRTGAAALDPEQITANLCLALHWLGLPAPVQARQWPASELLDWAMPRWNQRTRPDGRQVAAAQHIAALS